MTVVETVIEELEQFNQLIIDSLNSKNISNTGEAAKSLRVKVDGNTIQSLDIFYLEFLDKGRGKGKFPDLNKIKSWVQSKLGITDENEINQVAFFVSRNIAKLGTAIFRDNSKGIEIDKKVAILRADIKENIGKAAKSEMIQKLDRFKKLRKTKFQI